MAFQENSSPLTILLSDSGSSWPPRVTYGPGPILENTGCGYDSLTGLSFQIIDTATFNPRESESLLLSFLPEDLNTDLVDLHCHSTASDGILSPTELVSRAKSQGVTLMALTDHDTVGGVAEAQAAGDQLGITVATGIEFSSLWGRRSVHIVGLNIDPASARLREAIALREELREERAERIAERLHKRGFEGALKGASYCWRFRAGAAAFCPLAGGSRAR